MLQQNAGIVFSLPDDSQIPRQISDTLRDLREKTDIREALMDCRIEALLAELYDRSCNAIGDTKGSEPIRHSEANFITCFKNTTAARRANSARCRSDPVFSPT